MAVSDINAAFDAAEASLAAAVDASIVHVPEDVYITTTDNAALDAAAVETAIAAMDNGLVADALNAAITSDSDLVAGALNAAITAAGNSNNNPKTDSALDALVVNAAASGTELEKITIVHTTMTVTETHTPDERPPVDDSSPAEASTLQPATPAGGKRKRSDSPSRSASFKKQTSGAKKKGRTPAVASSDTRGTIIAPVADDVDHIPEPREVQDSSKFYWEVEKVLARRKKGRRLEYLIQWKNCPDSQNTWEPIANLCDTALEDAKELDKKEREKSAQKKNQV